MKIKFRIISVISASALTTLMLGSCSPGEDSSGFEYMPDMYRSSAIEPYVDYGEIRGRENKEVKLLLSAKTPPHGTIPFYGTDQEEVSIMLPYHRLATKAFKTTHGMFDADFSDKDEYALAAADVNQLKLYSENAEQILSDGKVLFNQNCAHCHGKKGDGNGPMVESGAYVGVPDYANLKDLSDGQMFYSIYYGKGMMGAHSSIINKKEIWTIIHYIRKVQDEDYGKNLSNDAKTYTSVDSWENLDHHSIKGENLILDVLFEEGSYEINMTTSKEELENVKNFLINNPEVMIELVGYTDSNGSEATNKKLSQERANVVKAWLVDNGCNTANINAVGYGENMLIFNNHGTEDQGASRRTILIIQ